MKNTLKTITGLGCLFAVLLAGGENPDGSCNLVWTIGWLAASALCGWAFGKLTQKKEVKNV